MYDALFKILLLSGPGVDTSGIAPILLTEKPFKSDTKMTISIEFEIKHLVVDKKKVTLQIWDFSNKESLKHIHPSGVYRAKGAILIYNVTKETSVAELQNWITMTKKRIKFEENERFPIVVLGNKPYLEDKLQFYPQENSAFEKLVGVDKFIECSIRTGENIEEAFEALTRLMLAESEKILEKTKKWDGASSKRIKALKIENKEDGDYKKRIKELIERVEKGENSPEAYQQLLDNIDEVKRKTICITKKQARNEKAIMGFVFAIREYSGLKAYPYYPFNKDYLQKEINAIYKLIYKELMKTNPNIPLKRDLSEKRRIVENLRIFLGSENWINFSKKYEVHKFLKEKSGIRKEIIKILLYLIIGIILIILALNGYDGVITW